MSKKDKKLTKAAHIKRHTEGTSNEISFSVLDAAKNRVDDEEVKDDKIRVPRFKQMLGSRRTTSLSKTSSTSPEAEIDRRKKRRRNRRIAATAVVAMVALCLFSGGATFLYNEVTNYQEQLSLLDQSFGKIAEADKTIVAMDQIINGPVEGLTAETLEAIEGIIAGISETEQLLGEAEILAHSATDNMRGSSDKEAADQALTAVEARRGMLVKGEAILLADIQVKNDSDQIEQAWAMIIQADVVAREAAGLVTDTTNENVKASKEKTLEAVGLFEEASRLIEAIAASPLAPDVELLKGYVSKRVEAMYYALASDEAILVQDRQTAESQNAAYNAADAEASTIAADIPLDITQLAAKAYETYTKDQREQYMEARHKASTADAFLRDYLGT